MEDQRPAAGVAESPSEAPPSSGTDLFPRDLSRRLLPILLIGIAAYVVLFSFADARETAEHFDRVSLGRFSAVLALSFASLLVRTVRWRYLVRLIDVKLSFWEATLTFFVGVAMSVTPGKVGELIKCLLLKEEWEVPAARSAPLVLAERIMDLTAVLVLGGAGVLLMPGGLLAGGATLLVAAVLLALYTSRPVALFAIRLASRFAFVARRKDKAMTMYLSLEQVSRPGVAAVGMALALFAWALPGLSIYVLAGAFEGSKLSLAEGLVASCAPLLAGAIALIPGGLGATEASMAGVLVAVGGFSKSVAVAITLLARVASFWFAVLLGVAALATWRLRRRVASVTASAR